MTHRRFLITLVAVFALLLSVSGATAQPPGLPASTGCVAGSVYDPACDVDHDGDVDILDIQFTASHWGHSGTYSAAYWSLTGNAGTSSGTNFLGTTNAVSLTLAVSNTVVLRLEPTTGTPNLIGGYSGNSVTTGVVGATMSGGGEPGDA